MRMTIRRWEQREMCCGERDEERMPENGFIVSRETAREPCGVVRSFLRPLRFGRGECKVGVPSTDDSFCV
jgi:hypothetical protein